MGLITSQNFIEPLSITRDDIALLATPVSDILSLTICELISFYFGQVKAEIHVDDPLQFKISSVDGGLKKPYMV